MTFGRPIKDIYLIQFIKILMQCSSFVKLFFHLNILYFVLFSIVYGIWFVADDYLFWADEVRVPLSLHGQLVHLVPESGPRNAVDDRRSPSAQFATLYVPQRRL